MHVHALLCRHGMCLQVLLSATIVLPSVCQNIHKGPEDHVSEESEMVLI